MARTDIPEMGRLGLDSQGRLVQFPRVRSQDGREQLPIPPAVEDLTVDKTE